MEVVTPRLHSATIGSPSASAANGSARRTSSLIHEIQPPTRRLSAHQVLLLTPFGGNAQDASTPMRASLTRTSGPMTRPVSSSMSREPSSGPPPARARSSTGTGPSRLSSLALSSIPSTSERSDPSSVAPSREASGAEEDDDELLAVVGTVEMTRSNSLPVLTLRELEAMKDKDTELGIARGGEWAWIGEEDSVASEEEIITPGVAPALAEFAFQDPFAPQGGTFRRIEETARFGSYRPVATADDYRYSPSLARDRRQSDIPTPSARLSVSSQDSPTRPPRNGDSDTPRQSTTSGLESPRGTRIAPPQRPKITRYKTEPPRPHGLGLALVAHTPVQPGVRIMEEAGGSLGRKGFNLSTVERRERRHARMRDDRRESDESAPRRRGSWAPVDLLDELEISSLRERASISSTSSHGSLSFPRGSVGSVLATTASTLAEFGAGRGLGPAFALNDQSSTRRASMGGFATFSKTPGGMLRVWKLRRRADEPGRRGSAGETITSAPEGNWHERRGSWAEGWTQDSRE